MATGADTGDTTLSPDDAFAVLGNETRMEIVQSLAGADDPLSFSALRDRVGMRDSGQFNYHLEKLVGHFVEDTDDGYTLTRAGERVIEAVVSGAVTETPVIEPTPIEWACPLCGGTTELSFQQERIRVSCTECSGYAGRVSTIDPSAPEGQLEQGYIAGLRVPPAAILNREVPEVLQTALVWQYLEGFAASSGICPRCSASIERTLTACDDHEPGDGVCDSCNRKYRVQYESTCPNCPFRLTGPAPIAFRAQTELLDFSTDHGYNPVTPTPDQWRQVFQAWEEEVVSADPLRVRITWTIDGETISLTADEALNIVDLTRT